MAQVDYIAPVEAVHGKLSKQDRYGFAKRSAVNGHGNRIAYTFRSGKRSTKPTEDELARREKFSLVLKRTQQRMQDPVQMAQDQLAFAAQSKYKSFYRYVFNQEWNK